MTRNPNYIKSLSDEDRESFDKSRYIILYSLSMDESLLPTISNLYKNSDYREIPLEHFYKLLLLLVPKSDRKFPWPKRSIPVHKKELVSLIATWYETSYQQAVDYINIMMLTTGGQEELSYILEGSGLTDEEAEALLAPAEFKE